MSYKHRIYAINFVSLFPYSYSLDGVARAIKLAREAGYFGIQYSPLRGTRVRRDQEKYIISFEDAWDCGPIWKVLGRHLFGGDGPTLMDFILFNKLRSPFFQNAIPSMRHFGPMVVTEMHPDLSIRMEDYLAHVEKGGKLCIDTWHLRRAHRVNGTKLPPWQEVLKVLPDGAIGLIHVHPTRNEIDAFLRGEGETIAMLRRIGEMTTAPVIVEVFPRVLSWKGTVAWTKSLLDVTKRYLGDI